MQQDMRGAPVQRTHAPENGRQPQERKQIKPVPEPTKQRRRPTKAAHADLAGQRRDATSTAAAYLRQHANVPASASGSANVCTKQCNETPADVGALALCQHGGLQSNKYGI